MENGCMDYGCMDHGCMDKKKSSVYPSSGHPSSRLQAFAVFSGQTDLPWLHVLKPGFRHCFALLHDGRQWLSYDPLASYTELAVHRVPPEFDLPGWLAGRGLTVVPAPVLKGRKPAPLMPFTCVEAVKRVLGIHARRVLTPWQLYRFLTRQTIKGEPSWAV